MTQYSVVGGLKNLHTALSLPIVVYSRDVMFIANFLKMVALCLAHIFTVSIRAYMEMIYNTLCMLIPILVVRFEKKRIRLLNYFLYT